MSIVFWDQFVSKESSSTLDGFLEKFLSKKNEKLYILISLRMCNKNQNIEIKKNGIEEW